MKLTELSFMMEKFDGVRVFWDGKQLHSKKSRITINVPQGLQFPNFPFEGELWMGYNEKQQCIDFVQTRDEKLNWEDVKIMIFDAPQAPDQPYYQRLDLLRKSK
jgi:DNA ligase-1